MSVGQGLMEIAKVASDYINNGMGQQGQYAAVRNARSREAARKDKADDKPADTAPPVGLTPNNQAGGTDRIPSTPQFESTGGEEVV